jgi:hypothetical protein
MSELILFRSGQGAVGPAGVAGSSGAAGTPAPNITSATAAAAYRMSGNDSVFGFAGVITLPTGDPDYAHLAEIEVQAKGPGATGWTAIVRVPASSFGVTTVAYAGGEFAQPLADEGWSVQFVPLNEYGSPSTPGTPLAVAVDASKVTAVSGAVPGILTVDPVTRLVYEQVNYSPTLEGNHVPQNVTAMFSDNNGGRWVFIGAQLQTSAGQTFKLIRPKPGAATNWKVACAAGWIPGDPSVWLSALPSGFVPSASIAVGGLALPSATAATGATISAGAGGANPYNVKDNDTGRQYVKIPGPTWTDPADNNAAFVRIVGWCVDAAGNPAPADQGGTKVVLNGPNDPMGDVVHAGQTRATDPLLFDYNPAGSVYVYWREEMYLMNRNATGPNDWSDPTKSVLQTTAWSGAAYIQLAFGPLPAGAIPASRIDPATIPFLPNTNLIPNPGFEDGMVGWSSSLGAFVDPSGPYTGLLRCDVLDNNTDYILEDVFHPVRPGDVMYAEAVAGSNAGTSGVLRLFITWWDASHAYVPTAAQSPDLNPTVYAYDATTLRVTGTAPAGASYCKALVRPNNPGASSGIWFVDNVVLRPQPGTGDGTESDGRGGVKAKTGNGMTVDPTTKALITKLTGTGGLDFDGSGNNIAKLGYTMRIDGSGSIVLGNLPAVSGLPSLPSASYPAGAVILNTADSKVYRNPSGSAWLVSTAPGDLVAGAVASGVTIAAAQVSAGTLAAGVAYVGALVASQVTSGTFSGISMVLNLNGITTSVSNVFDSGLSTFVGTKVLNNSTGQYSVIAAAFLASVLGSASATMGTGSGLGYCQVFGGGGKYAQIYSDSVNYSMLQLGWGSNLFQVLVNNSVTSITAYALPGASPGAGSKQFWYDPATGNVKYAA